VAEKSILIDPDIQLVNANISLVKRSDPVKMRIVFESPSGAVIEVKSIKVTQSSTKKGFKVPEGTARARFIALRTRPEDNPNIDFFDPSPSIK